MVLRASDMVHRPTSTNELPKNRSIEIHSSTQKTMELSMLVTTLPRELRTCIAAFMWDIDDAAAAGLLAVVQVLHESSKTERIHCSFRALNLAARNGHLAVVRFLHASRSEGCSQFALNMAAAHGHLSVVEFLHQHRREGCTSYAMDTAAANGHLCVVKFLHQRRREGCTINAVDHAAANGHIQVVSYLLAHRTEGFSVAAVDRVGVNGHHETLRILVAHSQLCKTSLRWLEQVAAELSRCETTTIRDAHRSSIACG